MIPAPRCPPFLKGCLFAPPKCVCPTPFHDRKTKQKNKKNACTPCVLLFPFRESLCCRMGKTARLSACLPVCPNPVL